VDLLRRNATSILIEMELAEFKKEIEQKFKKSELKAW
jgi:hypothetical protein